MALDEGPRAVADVGSPRRKRRRRRRRVVPSPSRTRVVYRKSDSGEAAKFTRSPAYRKVRRRRYRTSDSGEAAAFTRSPEFRRTRRESQRQVMELLERLLTSPERGREDMRRAMRQAERGPRGTLDTAPPVPATMGIADDLGIPGVALKQIGESLFYTPAGLAEVGKAVYGDVKDSPSLLDVIEGDTEGLVPRRTAELGKEMGRQVVEDVRHPGENPGYLLMDLLALGGLGAGATSRAGAVRRARRDKKSKRETVGQAVRPDVPQRFFREENLAVEGSYSRSPLARYGQQLGDMLRDRGLPVGALRRSAPSKTGWELGENMRMVEAIERAPATALQRQGKRLRPAEQVAIRVVEEGRTIDERIRLHQAEARSGRRARDRRASVVQVGLLRKARKYVDESSGKPVLAASARPRLRKAQELVRRNADLREEILLGLERLSPEEIAARIQAPGRVVGGARWQTGQPRRRAERQVERAEAGLARQGRVVEGVRERVRASEERTRPLTLAEAEKRAADVEKGWRKIVDAKAASMMPGNLRQEVNRRNRENRRLRNRGRPEKPTIKQEVGAAAEREVLRMLEASDHPAAQRFLAELQEAGRLREGLARFRGRGDSLLPEEAGAPERATSRARRELLGTTKADTDVGLEGILRHEERRERNLQRRAEGARERVDAEPAEGLLGAEDFTGGATRIPYERGAPALSPGAFVRGIRGSYGGLERGRAIGYPRELPTTTAPFTGEALLSGFFRTDTTNLVGADLLRAQRFAAVLRGRDALIAAAKDVPDDPLGAVPIRVDDLRNRSLPASVREAIEAAEAKDMTRRHLRDLERDRGIEALQREAFPDMSWDEFVRRQAAGDTDIEGVKWVDADLLDASGLNAPPSLLASATRKAKGARAALTFADIINDASRVAILYLKPAYLAPNVLGNLAMNLVQQGVYAPVNLAKSSRLSARLGPEGAAIVDSVMGEGFAAALRGEGQIARVVANRLANVWGKAVDVPFRRAAFLHEARRAGYRKLSDVRRLLEDPALRGELVQVARRANREIIDYSRLSPLERAVVRRVVFFFPWIKGSTLYGARFPFEHPVQSMVAVQVGREGEEQALEDLGPALGFGRGMFKVGERDGLPLIINPASISVLATPLELGEAAVSFAQGERAPGRELVESLSPVLGAGLTALTGYDVFRRREVDPGLGTFASELTEGLPQVRLAERLGASEQERKRRLYPDTPTDAALQFGFGGAAPRPYNPEVAEQIIRREEREGMSFEERARQDVHAEVARARRLFRTVGEKLPDQYREFQQRDLLVKLGREGLKEDLDAERLTEAQEVGVLLSVAFAQIPEVQEGEYAWLVAYEEARGDPRDGDRTPAGRMHRLRLRLEDVLGFNDLSRFESYLNRVEASNQYQAANG